MEAEDIVADSDLSLPYDEVPSSSQIAEELDTIGSNSELALGLGLGTLALTVPNPMEMPFVEHSAEMLGTLRLSLRLEMIPAIRVSPLLVRNQYSVLALTGGSTGRPPPTGPMECGFATCIAGVHVCFTILATEEVTPQRLSSPSLELRTRRQIHRQQNCGFRQECTTC
jgi:hypothetical protein